MSKLNDRKQAAKQICIAAKQYKKKLVGKTFLYVFDGRYIEVMFKTSNFKHLTGVESNLSAKSFYKLAVDGKLQGTQIFFSAQHPFQLSKRKIQHINNISNLATSESFLLEDITTSTQTYKFGSTDLNFTLCFNKQNPTGIKSDAYFTVESLRDEDCFDRSANVYSITHILARANDIPIYTDVLYIEKGKSLSDIPQSVFSKLSAELKQQSNLLINNYKFSFSRATQKAFAEKAAEKPMQQHNDKSKDDITH